MYGCPVALPTTHHRRSPRIARSLPLHLLLCADPLPTPEMYFRDANGKLRTVRGTSQLESIHRFLAEFMPGTHMGVEGADAALTHFGYR